MYNPYIQLEQHGGGLKLNVCKVVTRLENDIEKIFKDITNLKMFGLVFQKKGAKNVSLQFARKGGFKLTVATDASHRQSFDS